MLSNKWLQKIALASGLAGAAIVAPSLSQAATFVIVNADSAGQGFNDTTAATPVGGNSGTTIGQQRMIAFQAAANVWASLLTSNVTIRVNSKFSALSCTASSGTLGSAGPVTVHRDFTNAPRAATYYVAAQASSLTGSDVSPSQDDISASFNGNIGTPGCLTSLSWYLGLDGNAPNGSLDFISVLIHELGHGLGVLSLVDLSTGAKFNGFDDAYMVNLERHSASPSDYPSMSDAQRLAASTDNGNLHWIGANVQAAAGNLTAGTVGTHVRMYAPSTVKQGSSVSHWDDVLTPNQVMEWQYTEPLHAPLMELALFRDIGWAVNPRYCEALAKGPEFSGDGKGDLAWRSNAGDIGMWFMNGATLSSGPGLGTVPTNWRLVASADFNGDGKSDLLWRNMSTGEAAVWFISGVTVTGSVSVGTIGLDWRIAGAADFNADGKADILWRNANGSTAIWLLNNGVLQSSGGLGTVANDWRIVGIADFNADNKADILWRSTTGETAIWLMNGTSLQSSAGLGTVTNDWRIVGVGDFNGDGKTDILWRNDSTAYAMWFMNGAAVASSAAVGNIGSDWHLAGTNDYNADGKADLLWRQDSGTVGVWLMNGATISSSGAISGVGYTWHILNGEQDRPPVLYNLGPC